MFDKRYFYLVKLQYLGFRFHGWQKQPNLLTVERMVQRTLKFILERNNFKILPAGRTDAKVSVNQTYMSLFVDDEPLKLEGFLDLFNENLPQDIRVLSIVPTEKDLNIIQHPKVKEYLYLFSFGSKNHPFSAPFMIHFRGALNIELMTEAAQLFEGEHDFRNFAYKANENTQTVLTVDHCGLERNTEFTANFFPDESFLLRVRGAGFKRHQIRLMMGALVDVGRGDLHLDDFKRAIAADPKIKLDHIAQASGLILNRVNLLDGNQ